MDDDDVAWRAETERLRREAAALLMRSGWWAEELRRERELERRPPPSFRPRATDPGRSSDPRQADRR